MNEQKTRQEIIDKRLAKAGWNVSDPAQVTEELDIIIAQKEQTAYVDLRGDITLLRN